MEMGDLEAHLVRLFDAPEVVITAFVLAIGVGALHALAPGHGKAIAAAYLVGGRARTRDAALLGGVVALMHTVSVAVLALAWSLLSTGGGFAAQAVTAWMQVAAAAGVVAVGVVMVRRRRHGHSHGHFHVHGPAHDPDPAHAHAGVGAPGTAHPPAPARTHAAGHLHADGPLHAGAEAAEDADGSGLSRRLLVALGVSGGLLPSPSAFLVLLSGILTGRLLYAGALVAAFAIGMAATLTIVGVAVLRGRDLLADRSAGGGVLAAVHRWVPAVGAAGVLGLGLVYLTVALRVALAV